MAEALDQRFEITSVGDDPADLIALRLAWFPEDEPGFADRFAQWWAEEKAHRRAWVARDASGLAIGMANAQIFRRMPTPGRPTTRWLYAANVFVSPVWRRRGVGAALMATMVEWARVEDMARVVLAPSEMSRSFYARLGFRDANDLARLDL